MRQEHKGHHGSGSGLSLHERDFSVMDDEAVREHRRLLVPLFGGDEESEDVENVVYTYVKDYILVKHDGIFHMVQLTGGDPKLISWEKVRSMPRLQEWCMEYFD